MYSHSHASFSQVLKTSLHILVIIIHLLLKELSFLVELVECLLQLVQFVLALLTMAMLVSNVLSNDRVKNWQDLEHSVTLAMALMIS